MKTTLEGNIAVAALDTSFSGLDEKHLIETTRSLMATIENMSEPKLVLDMSGTEYFGTAFFDLLTRVWHRVQRRGGMMVLAAVQPMCREVFEKAKMDTIWTFYPTVDDAIKALSET